MNSITRVAGAIVAIAAVALAGTATVASADERRAQPTAQLTLNPQPEPPGIVRLNPQPEPPGAICQTCEPSPPPPPPGPTGPPPPKYVFNAIGLWVGATEDASWDEIYLKINDRKVWGPYGIPDCGLGYCEHPFNGAVPFTYFSSFVKVSLYDEDWPDADDHLGTWYVWTNALPYAGLPFNLDGADYLLEYRISGPV